MACRYYPDFDFHGTFLVRCICEFTYNHKRNRYLTNGGDQTTHDINSLLTIVELLFTFVRLSSRSSSTPRSRNLLHVQLIITHAHMFKAMLQNYAHAHSSSPHFRPLTGKNPGQVVSRKDISSAHPPKKANWKKASDEGWTTEYVKRIDDIIRPLIGIHVFYPSIEAVNHSLVPRPMFAPHRMVWLRKFKSWG